jgi:hypothetical protein
MSFGSIGKKFLPKPTKGGLKSQFENDQEDIAEDPETNASVCSECGAKLTKNNPKTPSPSKMKSPKTDLNSGKAKIMALIAGRIKK